MIKKFFNDLWEYFDCEVVFKLVSCTSNKYDFSSKCPLGKKIEYFEYFPERNCDPMPRNRASSFYVEFFQQISFGGSHKTGRNK